MTRRLMVVAAMALGACSTPPHSHQASSAVLVEPSTSTSDTTSTTSTVVERTTTTARASRSYTRPVSPAPNLTSRPGATAGPVGAGGITLTSTAYCETSRMADGQPAHIGAVAANGWPLGTRLKVSDSPYGPGVFTVDDRYGYGTQLDFATAGDCMLARQWGRRTVTVEVAA